MLFLVELPEFSMKVLEVLRQRLENKVATISLTQSLLTYPANLKLTAAMNLCPGGPLSRRLMYDQKVGYT